MKIERVDHFVLTGERIRAEGEISYSRVRGLITQTPIGDVVKHMEAKGIRIVEGPVKRTGALGEIESVYVRDPDDNLIEISNYIGRKVIQ